MTIELETPRLFLRPLAPKDADAHIAMMRDARVARFLTFEQRPQSRETEWRSFASLIGHWQLRGFGFFSVFERASGEWVGRVGPWMPEGWPGLEAGWSIAPAHWGKGYAPEAAIAAVLWVFARFPDLSRIISLIDPANENSQKVAAKIGEARSGETFQLEQLTLDIWAASRQDFLARHGGPH